MARRAGDPPNILFLAGTDDPHHRTSALDAARAFSDAGYAQTLRVRKGDHALTAPDLDWAFDALVAR